MLPRLWIIALFLAAEVLLGVCGAGAQPAETTPLQLEAKIPLGNVRGRIDHMAVDLKRQRLFVAELGNDSAGVVDLANRKLLQTIAGLKEPQGVGYEPSTDMLYVANASDGSVRLFDGNEYKPKGQIELGSDADNVRVDAGANRIFIGYGSGALAVIDPTTRSKVGDIPVKAHDAKRDRVYVSCGSGFIDVLEAKGTTYPRIARIPTVSGARTSLFVPELDRLLLAVRTNAAEPAAIWVFRPIP